MPVKQDTTLTFSMPEPKTGLQRLSAGTHHPATPSSRGYDGSSESSDENDISAFEDESSPEAAPVTKRSRKTVKDKSTTGNMAPPPFTPHTNTFTPVGSGSSSSSSRNSQEGTSVTPGGGHLNINVDRANAYITPGFTSINGSLLTPKSGGTPTSGGSNASKLKRTYTEAMGTTAASGNKLVAERDPENHEIKRLRDEGLKWGEIADFLNKKRIAAGKVPGLTDNAIYSRYTRNAPRIAANSGEVWNPATAHPKPANTESERHKLSPLPLFSARDDELLVLAYQEIMSETWDLVAARLFKKGGGKYDKEACARRYQSL